MRQRAEPLKLGHYQQLNVGSRVRYDGRTLTVVQIGQVTKLWGKIGTDFVRVVMA